MTYDLKNFSIEHHTKDAIPETVLFNILDKLVNNNIKLYFNFDPIQLRDLNLDRFLIKKSEISRIFHILHKTKHHDKRFHSVIFNSMSIQFSTNIFVNNDNRFNYLQKYFKFYKKYRMNNDGFIVIYCNNPNGYYKEWINYEKQLPNLIKKIRNINKKNKIVLRFHRKHNKTIKNNLLYDLKKIDESIEIDESEFNKTINQSYCIFIQNASIILDYINEGIPLFNPNIIPFDDYNGCYNNIELLNNIEKNKNNLIDRKKFLIDSYNHIIFDSEYRDNIDYVKQFYLKNINL